MQAIEHHKEEVGIEINLERGEKRRDCLARDQKLHQPHFLIRFNHFLEGRKKSCKSVLVQCIELETKKISL